MGELRFAGVDWASEEHAVRVVDEHGRIVEGRRYRHAEVALRTVCSRLVRPSVRLVVLERPDGRRRIGSTPAGGDAGSTAAPCVQPQPPPPCWPDEARDSVPTKTPNADRFMESGRPAGTGDADHRIATRPEETATGAPFVAEALVADETSAIMAVRYGASLAGGSRLGAITRAIGPVRASDVAAVAVPLRAL